MHTPPLVSRGDLRHAHKQLYEAEVHLDAIVLRDVYDSKDKAADRQQILLTLALLYSCMDRKREAAAQFKSCGCLEAEALTPLWQAVEKAVAL